MRLRLSGIGARLLALVGLVVAALGAIGVLVFLSYERIERLVTQQASAEVAKVVANAALGRELSLVLARFNELALACREDKPPKELLASLRTTLARLRSQGPNAKIATSIIEFANAGDGLLDECEKLVLALAQTRASDQRVLAELTVLEDLVARALIEQTMAGRSASHLDQAMAQTAGFRETMLEVGKRLGTLSISTSTSDDRRGLTPVEMLSDLAVRLQSFVNATPAMGRQATALRALVLRHREHAKGQERALRLFDELVKGTQQVRDSLLLQVAALDRDAAIRTATMDSALQELIQEARRSLIGAVALVAVIALLLSIALIRVGIKRPLDEILRQVERIRSGAPPQTLQARDDEWGRIQTALSAMSTELSAASAELEQALIAARSAAEAKTRFLANVSHELRTPMNAVLGMLKLLQRTQLTGRQSDYVTKTEGAARSLLALLDDVLDFSKAEAEKMTLDPRPFRIDQLMRDLSVILAASVGAKPVEVLFDIDPELPRSLVGDDLRLQQILINLGGNAVKFTDAGEVVVRVRVLESDARQALVEFQVSDTGIGIAPEKQVHIFSGFSQAEATITRRFGGTGLGLAICKKLVELMGGEIVVESAPGQGSRFRFAIRLLRAQDGSSAGLAVARQLQALRVLVVDDNTTARELLADMARTLGWQADVADSGAKAMELARARLASGDPYDAVFVDWQMPAMDGWETTEALRRLQGHGTTTVMMVTAHGREMLAQRSASELATLGGFLVKPVTASMLLDAVTDARLGRSPFARVETGSQTPTQRLVGMAVLLVEDNPNNQQVAKELLEAEGASVAVADHGQECLDILERAGTRFDAVLMDLQMPVMDGLSATRRIRQDPRFQRLAIIAMTANAMASDRQACLEAGMNDHIGKPFDLDDLVRVLRRLAGRGEDQETSARPPQASLGMNALAHAQAIEVELTQAIARLGGRADVYRRMLQRFLKDLPQITEKIREAVEAQQWPQAAAQTHTLKGLAGTLGAPGWQEALRSAEKAFAGASLKPEEARRLLDAIGERAALIQTGAPALIAALAQESGDPDAGATANPLKVRQALEDLLGLLRASDMSAVDHYEAMQAGLKAWPKEPVAALDEAMSGLDFDDAIVRCEALLMQSPPTSS